MAFHSGIKKLIIFEGTNDIGTSKLSPDSLAERLADAYRQITDYARAKGIEVYVATITPTKGNAWFSKNHEKRTPTHKQLDKKDLPQYPYRLRQTRQRPQGPGKVKG